MIPYCRPDHVTDLILREVTTAAEDLNPELVNRTIEAVTGEISSLLAARYRQPFEPVPEIIRWICATVSAWRVVGAITSLMDTESASDNQWLPIQTQYKRAWELLEELAKGKIKLATSDEIIEEREDAGVAVVSPGPYFTNMDKYY